MDPWRAPGTVLGTQEMLFVTIIATPILRKGKDEINRMFPL